MPPDRSTTRRSNTRHCRRAWRRRRPKRFLQRHQSPKCLRSCSRYRRSHRQRSSSRYCCFACPRSVHRRRYSSFGRPNRPCLLRRRWSGYSCRRCRSGWLDPSTPGFVHPTPGGRRRRRTPARMCHSAKGTEKVSKGACAYSVAGTRNGPFGVLVQLRWSVFGARGTVVRQC